MVKLDDTVTFIRKDYSEIQARVTSVFNMGKDVKPLLNLDIGDGAEIHGVANIDDVKENAEDKKYLCWKQGKPSASKPKKETPRPEPEDETEED